VSKKTIKRGFSLIEVMVAMAVFSVGVVAVSWLFPIALDNLKESQRATTMALVARQTMDEILVKRMFITPVNNKMLVNPSPRNDCQVYYSGKPPEPSGAPRYQEVEVEVIWMYKGIPRTYKLSGIVSR
jgi:prepilin-type N-terminal cleavage/methylation domain-containing protein